MCYCRLVGHVCKAARRRPSSTHRTSLGFPQVRHSRLHGESRVSVTARLLSPSVEARHWRAYRTIGGHANDLPRMNLIWRSHALVGILSTMRGFPDDRASLRVRQIWESVLDRPTPVSLLFCPACKLPIVWAMCLT